MTAMRPRPKVMTLTETAAERVRDIMTRSERPVAGLRIGVKNGGCAGMEYTMEWAERQEALDEVVEDKGVKLFIDPKVETMTASRIGESSDRELVGGWCVRVGGPVTSAADVVAGATLLERRQALGRVLGAEDLRAQRSDHVEARLQTLVVHLPRDGQGVAHAEGRGIRDHRG
jgi:iron-sulfur cluster assembly accessory protein